MTMEKMTVTNVTVTTKYDGDKKMVMTKNMTNMTKMMMTTVDKCDLFHVPFLLSGGAKSAPHSSTLSITLTNYSNHSCHGNGITNDHLS